MSALTISELAKLCNSQAAMTSAYRSGLILQERGWMRYPAACWDKPAVVAFDGEHCVAGVNFTEDGDDLVFRIDFAWCNRPNALAPVLLRLRRKIRATKCTHVAFTCHNGNAEMARVVEMLGVRPHSRHYQFAIARDTTVTGAA